MAMIPMIANNTFIKSSFNNIITVKAINAKFKMILLIEV